MNNKILLAALLALSLPALAGRPLSTEDANSLDDGQCQLEAWANRTRSNATEMVAVPACAFLKVEAQLGTGWVRENGETKLAAQFFQVKHAFSAVVHLNLGTTRNREEARNLTLWGIAAEKPVTERLTLVGEVYGENTRDPFYRAGGRFTVIPEMLDVDLTYVGRSGGSKEDRLWSIGFHLEGDVFK